MAPEKLTIKLYSDTHFSRGEGTAGLVDQEIDHDEYGLPQVNGKTLHGLLRDSWLSMQAVFPEELEKAAQRVLGKEQEHFDTAILHIGNAVLPPEVRELVKISQKRKDHPLTPDQILDTLTDIRTQTSIDRKTGAAERNSLRSIRVLIRQLPLPLEAPLEWIEPPTPDDIKALALMLLGVRHAGLARNRGLGLLELSLDGSPSDTIRLAEVQNNAD